MYSKPVGKTLPLEASLSCGSVHVWKPGFLHCGTFLCPSPCRIHLASTCFLSFYNETTQPIITVVITILLRMEKRSTLKIIGVLVATAGAMVVTWFSGGGTEGKSILLGSLFFLINCVSSSLFVVRSPRVFFNLNRSFRRR